MNILLQGFTKKCLHSRSATAGLLITQLVHGIIKACIALVQESKHIVYSCWGKQRCTFPAYRNHVGIWRSGKEHASYSSWILSAFTQGINRVLLWSHVAVTSQNVGCNTKSKTSCTANDIMRQVINMYLEIIKANEWPEPFSYEENAIGDKWSVCCCVLLDVCQSDVSSTSSVSSWSLQQNGWDQWAHSFADPVWRYKIV